MTTVDLTKELFERYQTCRSIKLRNQIVELNSNLVRKIANQVCQKCSEPYADLEQVGFLGLIKAVESFDLSKGFCFSSFAVPYIKGEMQHYLRDRGGNLVKVPRSWQEISTKSNTVRQKALKSGMQLSDREVAVRLGIKFELLKNAEAASKAYLVWLDEFEYRDLGEIPLEAPTPTYKAQNLENFLWGEEMNKLQSALGQLDSQTRQAIEIYLFRRQATRTACQSLGLSSSELSLRLKSGCRQLSELV